jgi:cellulose synthase/poly-beta-1,6-N-acetylglucosamine synthase-like glycosyltransferase
MKSINLNKLMNKNPSVSVVVATYNGKDVLKETINGILKVDYSELIEIIVVNDGSTDETKEMLEKEFSKNKKIKIINQKNSGVTKARNAGIKIAKGKIIVNMDHDCIPEKNWLKDLIKGFTNEKIGMVSSFDLYGGTSTAFNAEALKKVGGYDEDYFYFREDSDLAFKIMEAGYELKQVKAEYFHNHEMEKPKGIINLIKYALKRAKYRENDVLLYKKHSKNEKVKEFLGIKYGFIVSPKKDMQLSLGRWWPGMNKFELSSPRGITFIENKSPMHAILIFLGSFFYMLLLKLIRLKASIKYKKLLI